MAKAEKIVTGKDAAVKIGNQYEMILLTAERARELQHGANPLIESDFGHVTTALNEVEQGVVDKHGLYKLNDDDDSEEDDSEL